MPSHEERWLDAEAGPIVRPYALIGGRTRHAGQKFDLVATVRTTRKAVSDPAALSPEQMWALNLARRPTTVADLASELNLPLGVVRILLADLRDLGYMIIRSPAQTHQQRDGHILREVLNGLRAL
ncbi:MAG TPA: DUF742 domain-containing protein [Streptosporangiaceae bacterium]|nr:DUF742 domain-containing protein [Streptosporangiaceae bacterium]